MTKKYKLNAAQKKWLAALESGQYRRTTGQLKKGRGYCCLGVACRVLGVEFAEADMEAPPQVRDALKLRGSLGEGREAFGNDYESLADANDSGQTFKKIAAAIRLDPSRFFFD